MNDGVNLTVVRKIAEVAREDWDGLAEGLSPFLKWDWLDSLEQAGCVNEKTGWLPHHIVVEKAGQLIGACPMYLKLHSMGSLFSITNGPKRRIMRAFNITRKCWSACLSLR